MGLMSYIERLRSAPLRERREAAATLTFVVVGIIVVLWLALIVVRFGIDLSSPQKVEGGGIQAPY